MKITILAATVCTLVISLLVSSTAEAKESHSVRGHVTKNGTYVAPHRSTNQDSSRSNNWSSKGNANPYTGKKGTQDPYRPRSPRK